MRLIDIDNITALDIMHNVICDKEVAHKMLEFLKDQNTIQPQGVDKDRVEHVIKVLEFCKQRHIDIVTDLPHTVEIERGTISAYSMALKVVRECLLQPYKESEEE